MYDELLTVLEENNKSINDILYITAHRSDRWDIDTLPADKFNIPIDIFCEVSKTVNPLYIKSDINIVGNDFYMTTNTMSGYFEYVEIPQEEERDIDSAKIALQFPEEKLGVLLGMETHDQDE